MITKEEMKQAAVKANLNVSQIEKDYVLSWFLAGISEHPQLSKNWIFKGGTCLRKLYIENYRYSEDLDFTAIGLDGFSIEDINQQLSDVSKWFIKKTGIEIVDTKFIFEDIQNQKGQNIIQCKVYYFGPFSPKSPKQWPRIKLDITCDEIIVTSPEFKKIIHPYSDRTLLENITVNSYSIYDLFSEKIRALFERTRPRDLYDVIEINKRYHSSIDMQKLKYCLTKKCDFKKIHHLKLDGMKIDACKGGWNDQLAHQLDNLPKFEKYWEEFLIFYKKLHIDN